MPGHHRTPCCSRLAGFLALLWASPMTILAESNCSHVLFTGGQYSGIYSTSGYMVNGRHLFTAEDDDGNVANLAFFLLSGRRRLVDAAGKHLAGSSHETDGYQHGESASSISEEFRLPRATGLETVRDRAEETLDACDYGYWGTFMYLDDDFGNASAVVFPAYYVFDCSPHPVDVNETWYELDCSGCTGTGISISIECHETATTSDGTTMTSYTSEEDDNDDGDVTMTTDDTSTTTATTSDEEDDDEDDDEDLTTSDCDDVRLLGGRYSGVYSWAREVNDRSAFIAEDDDGNFVRLAFYYFSDRRRRRRRLEAAGAEEDLDEGSFFPHHGITPTEGEAEQHGSGIVLPGASPLGTARDHAGAALDACSDGYWLNYALVFDDYGNATGLDSPYYFALDCAMHPVNVTQPWFELYNCSDCEATETSVSISCEDTTSDETAATSASGEDNDDLDGEQDASRQGDDGGLDGEDDSDVWSFPMAAVIGIAVVAGLLVIGVIVGCWWCSRKANGASSDPAPVQAQPVAEGEAVTSRAPDPASSLPISHVPSAPPIATVRDQAPPPPPPYATIAAEKVAGEGQTPPPFCASSEKI